MKKITLLLFSCFVSSFCFSQLNMSYVGQITYPLELSDVWGYVDPEDGTEYAIVGIENGTSVVSLADPANPVEVAFLPGPSTIWRDIKVWGEFAYVTNESGGGLHVLDLSELPNEVTAEFWAPSLPPGGTLGNCHNIWIDEFGVAYLSGCNVNNGGLLYVDVATDPGNPIYLGAAPPVYSHDIYVRNNLAYDSQINAGHFAIMDVSDKTNTVLLGTQQTPSNTTHNAWLSDDGNILFTTDETGNAPVASYDVSDPTDIKELDQFRPLFTLGEGVAPHNVHVWNDFLIISYYTDGCILVDASRPENLVEVGNFDTYFPVSTGFNGAWGAYPFLPSGLVLVSDIQDGLYVLEPNYVRACFLEGNVTDASTGAALFGAKVDILGDVAFGNTDLFGEYGTGLATAGTYDVEVSKPGYISQVVSVDLENGEVTELDIALEALPSFAFSGRVIDLETEEAVAEAKVLIENDDFSFALDTDADGNFNVGTFYEGNYNIIADKWGYRANFLNSNDFNEGNTFIEISIEKGIEDVFSLDLGWELSGNASQGAFELGDPIGVIPAQFPVEIQPENDVEEDMGNSCYVTGNTSSVEQGIQLTGTTRITSPSFDLSQMGEPRISYHYWIFNVNINNFGVGNDEIIVRLNNGNETVTIGEYAYLDGTAAPEWLSDEIVVSDFIEPTENMTISFEIGDFDPNLLDAAEVAIDYFQAWDANPPSSVGNRFDESISLSVSPNPSADEFGVNYELEALSLDSKLLIFNALGQKISSFNLASQNGKIVLGGDFEKGVYLAKIEQEGKTSRAIRLVKQ